MRQFLGCYSLGDDELLGVLRQKKRGANTLAAIKQIRAKRSDNETIHVILDHLPAHQDDKIGTWSANSASRARTRCQQQASQLTSGTHA